MNNLSHFKSYFETNMTQAAKSLYSQDHKVYGLTLISFSLFRYFNTTNYLPTFEHAQLLLYEKSPPIKAIEFTFFRYRLNCHGAMTSKPFAIE